MLPESFAGAAQNAGEAHKSTTANVRMLDLGRLLIVPLGKPHLFYFTVKLTVGVRTSFRALSVTFIFSEYSPGSSDARGKSFSTVTCWAEAPGSVVTSSV